MISGFVRGQDLMFSRITIAADTINYLTARFTFMTSEWEKTIKIAHFSNGTNSKEIELTDNEIRESDGLNLTEGKWEVSLTGHVLEEGEMVERITTDVAYLTVVPSAVQDGEPLPDLASYGEQILAEVRDIHREVDEQLADQDERVDARLEENEEIIDSAFGGLKNWRDGKWLKLWAGSEEDFASADKSDDTIYLIDFGLNGRPAPEAEGGNE